MLPYENMVASYIKGSGNHVMYRVTPVFNDSNLLCNGVIIEALSVEDKGKGISFNVFCFNVQPGVIIDYKDGSNQADPNYLADTSEKDNEFNEQTPEQPLDSNVITGSYVANKNTKKFHYSWCSSVEAMKEKNKLYHNGPRDELINNGYVPCKNCNP
ncbi:MULTISPECIES: DNA/RNA non-specific endonuclease [unclassified Butyrivibrio]|uniref:DNA/RNA non-specific endonuclease n=1 Tax=unclassified Butyrivibrio TaxID=2639466 RepID=UPI001FA72E47